MSNGAVIEQGTHDELLEADGAYTRLVKAQDLGGSEDTDNSDGEGEKDRVALVRTQTQVGSLYGETAKQSSGDGINYNLLKCICIVLWEQRDLWPWLLILTIASFAGGVFHTSMSLAILTLIRSNISCPGYSLRACH